MSHQEIEALKSKQLRIVDYDNTDDSDLKRLMCSFNRLASYEQPDGYLLDGQIVFMVEHFSVSQYIHSKKGDIGQKVKAIQAKRSKLDEDAEFELKPSLHNLIDSFLCGYKKHVQSIPEYKKHIKNILPDKEYRLVFLIEDTSEQGIYIEQFDNRPRNPLLFDLIAHELLKNEDTLWAVIYVFGSEVKELWGCTIQELKKRKESGELLSADKYRTLHNREHKQISSDSDQEDIENVHICLKDQI